VPKIKVMTAPWLSPVTTLSLAILVLAVASGFLIASAVRRRERRSARNRTRELERAFSDLLSGRIGAMALRRLVRAADECIYWSALERHSPDMTRPQRLELSRALERNRHERAERLALRDESPWRRELAARRLALLRSSLARQSLRRALAEGPAAVTLAAARALARDRDATALRWVLANPESFASRSPATRAALLRAFGRGSLPVLAEALERGDSDPRMERAVLETLGAMRCGLALEAIERRLRHADVEVRIAAARALGRYEAGECDGALIASLRDEAWQVRALAAWALGRARVPTAIQPLTARLSDRSWWVRRHSAYALASLGQEGRRALRRVIEASPDPYARDIALEALETSDLA
jgi:HEAT repeat protein